MARTTARRSRREYTEEEKEQFRAERAAKRAATDALADALLIKLETAPVWEGLMRAAAVHHERPGTVNLLLLSAQVPHAERVDDSRGWLKAGRVVRKGETASARIYTTVMRRDKKADTAEQTGESTGQDAQAGEAEETGKRGKVAAFSTGCVFTLEQTEPAKGYTEEDYQIPRPYAVDANRAARAVRALLARQGFDVEARPGHHYTVTLDGREDGADGRWVLPVDADRADDPSTTRELLAVVARLHCDGPIAQATSVITGAWSDEVAESAAHLAARMLGLPAGPAPVPELGEFADMFVEDLRDSLIKKLADASISIGRELAAAVTRRA